MRYAFCAILVFSFVQSSEAARYRYLAQSQVQYQAQPQAQQPQVQQPQAQQVASLPPCCGPAGAMPPEATPVVPLSPESAVPPAPVPTGRAGAFSSAQPSEYRTWTDSSGEFTCKARFVEFVGSQVRLRREDGHYIRIEYGLLCESDRGIAFNQNRLIAAR